MQRNFFGATILFGLAFIEMASPGWSGAFFEPVDVSPAQSRIISAIFMTGAIVLMFGPSND